MFEEKLLSTIVIIIISLHFNDHELLGHCSVGVSPRKILSTTDTERHSSTEGIPCTYLLRGISINSTNYSAGILFAVSFGT
jgi:hypothetical protein